MKVTIQVRVAPFWRLARTSKTKPARRPRPERVRRFSHNTAYRRGAPPLLVWALSVILLIGFMSVSMFATIPAVLDREAPPPQTLVFDDEDPALPLVAETTLDCQVLLNRGGRLECLESFEFRPDHSGAVQFWVVSPGTNH